MTIFRLRCHPNKNHLPNFFFLRLVGRPGKYLYVVGSYRMEEVMHKEIKKKKKKLQKRIITFISYHVISGCLLDK